MANNYEIDYSDDRFKDVEADKQAALDEVDQTYGEMIGNTDKYYQEQIDASKEWADKQSQIQNEKTDFAIEQINQQKEQAKKDYTKEQSGAYVDWQKQSNQYGANAEKVAAGGLQNTGFAESSQVSMYNTYQNRVAMARESYNRAVLNYDNAIKDAQLQNNSALAEIAYKALQQQLELSLQGFQYKNQLIIDQANKKTQLDSEYYARYQDVLRQINTENAMAEEVRQYNARLAEEKRQYNETHELQEEQLAIEKEQLELQKKTSSSAGRKGTVRSSKPSATASGGVVKDGATANAVMKDDGDSGVDPVITNRHGDSWIEIPGHGRYSITEVYAYVQDGTIEEIEKGGKLTYKWVGKKSKSGVNVTPDAKGYAAKQKDLMRSAW